jgi:hypothetical protein
MNTNFATTHFDTSPCPILAVFDKSDVNYFGEVGFSHDGWTYVSKTDDADPEVTRTEHYATDGSQVVELDYTPFKPMSQLVFTWLVDMNFPERSDLASASHFSLPALSPLNQFDVERIWLWWRVHNLQGK